MAFPKGAKRPEGAGRQKGTPNKVTGLLRDAILEAADKAHEEGVVGYLVQQAKDNPSAFMTLLGKVLPMAVAGPGEDGEHLLRVLERRIVRPND